MIRVKDAWENETQFEVETDNFALKMRVASLESMVVQLTSKKPQLLKNNVKNMPVRLDQLPHRTSLLRHVGY